MTEAFPKLNRGGLLLNNLGLQMEDGHAYRFPRDYSYVEVPFLRAVSLASDEEVHEAVRNQRILITPACTLDVKGYYKALVKPNPILHKYSICPTVKLLDQEDGEQPTFSATFQKDFDFQDLNWCVRIYLIG